jgi:hypothetical protein
MTLLGASGILCALDERERAAASMHVFVGARWQAAVHLTHHCACEEPCCACFIKSPPAHAHRLTHTPPPPLLRPSRPQIDWSKVFKKGRDVNVLSAARFWLFGSRDVWFEIGLPLFLANGFGWSATWVGLFIGLYVVLYGNMQAFSTNLYK